MLSEPSHQDLPPESSQFSLTRPNTLDKIKNFHLEAQAGSVVRRLACARLSRTARELRTCARRRIYGPAGRTRRCRPIARLGRVRATRLKSQDTAPPLRVQKSRGLQGKRVHAIGFTRKTVEEYFGRQHNQVSKTLPEPFGVNEQHWAEVTDSSRRRHWPRSIKETAPMNR